MRWLTNWFSNFEPFEEPLIEGCVRYDTPEHYYAAHKTEDIDLRLKIASSTPAGAKKMAAKIDPVENWEEIKESVMWTALRWKFQKGSKWGDILASTYDIYLVEWNNWHDNFWGWCVCHRCSTKVGLMPQNKLGFLLMEQRMNLL
jgi:ribA/ribD-fused uncharacterized protein